MAQSKVDPRPVSLIVVCVLVVVVEVVVFVVVVDVVVVRAVVVVAEVVVVPASELGEQPNMAALRSPYHNVDENMNTSAV